MDDSVEIPVAYKGEELHFKAWLIVFGYSYKFKVIINDREIFFEPDNDGNFRALIDIDSSEHLHKNADSQLLKAIAEAIQLLVK